MIIGNGLLAKAFAPEFAHNDTVTVFASGVSNSRETRPEAFQRERDMLEAALDAHHMLVYFSTCSILDPQLAASPYVLHKLAMEQLIAERAPQMAIFRLPQLVGHTPNPHTLTNYLHHQIDTGAHFQLWSYARRNLIDVDDVAAIVHQLMQDGATGRTLNVACPFSVPVVELVAIFEQILGKRANYSLVAAGSHYSIDVAPTSAAAAAAGVVMDTHYIDRIIRKYYAPAN